MPITLDMGFADFDNQQVKAILEKYFRMRLEEAKLIGELCLANDVIFAIRVPGDMIVQRLDAGCMGKGLSIKAKTASVAFENITGLIPINYQQSKLYNSNPALAEKFGEMLNKKLEEDHRQIENLKFQLTASGGTKKEISKLQLITKMPASHIGSYLNHNSMLTSDASEIIAYVTEIAIREGKQDFIARLHPVTSDYDPALIATKDSSIRQSTSPHKLSEFYSCVDKFPEEEKIALEHRGLGTKIDHAVIAALEAINNSINHGPDTANPYSEGLIEEWIAFIPSYGIIHPLHHYSKEDHLIISILPTVFDKMRFFSFMDEHGYHYPYNKSWPLQEHKEWLNVNCNGRNVPIFSGDKPAFEMKFGFANVFASKYSELEQLKSFLAEQTPGCSKDR